MQTTTAVKMIELPGATSAQLSQIIQTKAEKGNRFLKAELNEHGFLATYYRTSGGYYVAAYYKKDGSFITKHHYHFWNETDGKPFKPVAFK